jgi:hypothetical protein
MMDAAAPSIVGRAREWGPLATRWYVDAGETNLSVNHQCVDFICDCTTLCCPVTCQMQGYDCGIADDGCSNMLDCGMCQAPQTCGGGGKANVCGP